MFLHTSQLWSIGVKYCSTFAVDLKRENFAVFRYWRVDSLLNPLKKKINLNSNIYPTRCNVTQFILSGNCSTCFGWYYHPSSRAQTTVSTAPGICHTVIAICRYRGRVGTGLSVLWVAYASHSTLKPVPALPR